MIKKGLHLLYAFLYICAKQKINIMAKQISPPKFTYFPLSQSSDHYNPELINLIEEDYTKPLKELGFTIESAISISNDEDHCTHIITYKHDGTTKFRPHLDAAITNHRDDGYQSYGNYFFGTLVLTIISDI